MSHGGSTVSGRTAGLRGLPCALGVVCSSPATLRGALHRVSRDQRRVDPDRAPAAAAPGEPSGPRPAGRWKKKRVVPQMLVLIVRVE